jgi:hypothetical protein
MHPYEQQVATLLDELGLSLPAPGRPEMIDFTQAEGCYVHHSRVPTATVGYALVSPTFARGRFPKFSYLDLMDKRSAMDEYEVCALADMCAADVTPPFWGNPGVFTDALRSVIDKYELWGFFNHDERAQQGTPFEIRPIGAGEDVNSDVLRQWRADFKKLPDGRKLMVVAILGLYNARACNAHWLVRVPKSWHAVDGIQVLRENGALSDWATLFATYSGW